MKNLLKLICIIVLFFSVNSCGVQWQYQAYNTAGYVDTLRSEGVAVDEIRTASQLRWKLRTDWSFANDYYFFLQQQDFSFFHRQYFNNRLWNFGWYSPHDYWLNWQGGWNSGYSYWSPWNQYPWYGNWGSSQWYWYQWNNPWQYSYVYGPRTSYLGNVYGGRYSNRNRFVYSNSNRSSLFSVSDGRTSDSRTYLPNNNSSVISNSINSRPTRPRVVNNKPVIIRWINGSNSNSRPSNSSSRPIYSKPSTNTKPNTNWNSSRPSNNNYNRPSNNSNYSKPSNTRSAPTNTIRKGGNPR
jgi:hypothetical protein